MAHLPGTPCGPLTSLYVRLPVCGMELTSMELTHGLPGEGEREEQTHFENATQGSMAAKHKYRPCFLKIVL